ncbi:MAG: hypothetical protein H7250_12665 [Flavobacterium sp.]|nr:hypothetical protein [Flavobacterium sp.]
MKFQLEKFVSINGLSNSSGLVLRKDNLYLIADNATFLYQYNLQKNTTNKIPLAENALDNIEKSKKPDFESIVFYDKKLLLFGSGSTSKRENLVTFNLKKQKSKWSDLSALYHLLKNKFMISDDEFNIEGVVYYKKSIFFFQRGNANSTKNGIIEINDKKHSLDFHPFEMPEIQHIAYTFTDATVVKNKIYFLASAENTESTYNDGEVLGSLMGCIDIKTKKLEFTQIVSENQKFEGITLYKKSKNEIQFLVCEDNDSENSDSTVYKLVVNL